MKTSCVLSGINILYTIFFQVVVLDLRLFRVNKRKLLDNEQSRIKTFSNRSVWSKSGEITQQSNLDDILRQRHLDNFNHTIDSGIQD